MYDIKQYSGQVEGLGNYEHNETAQRVLMLCKKMGEITGADKALLESEVPTDPMHVQRRGEDFTYIDDLIAEGFLIEQENKIYPTEKLLDRQQVPKV